MVMSEMLYREKIVTVNQLSDRQTGLTATCRGFSLCDGNPMANLTAETFLYVMQAAWKQSSLKFYTSK